MKKALTVPLAAPYLRSPDSTQRVMLDVIIGLIPVIVAGIYFYGVKALIVVASSVIACLCAEFVFCLVKRKEVTVFDYSAVITGILLGLCVSPKTPPWIAALGGVLAIVVFKQLMGGLGRNLTNPALSARVVLLIFCPELISKWVTPGVDAVSTATPLVIMKNTNLIKVKLPGYPDAVSSASLADGSKIPVLRDFLTGNVGGCIGEVSVLAIILGASYLLYRKVITVDTPFAFIAAVGILCWIFGGKTLFSGSFIYQILSGGLMLGAFFMATDYSTSPITRRGKIIMGIGCGLITFLIRTYTNYPEGVSFSIVIMNLFVPLINRFTITRGWTGASEKAAAFKKNALVRQQGTPM